MVIVVLLCTKQCEIEGIIPKTKTMHLVYDSIKINPILFDSHRDYLITYYNLSKLNKLQGQFGMVLIYNIVLTNIHLWVDYLLKCIYL